MKVDARTVSKRSTCIEVLTDKESSTSAVWLKNSNSDSFDARTTLEVFDDLTSDSSSTKQEADDNLL